MSKFPWWALIFIVGLVLFIATRPSKDTPKTQEVQAGPVIPEATAYAVDASGALTPEQISLLNNRIMMQIERGNPEQGVLLVKTTGGYDIREYGIKVAEKWKVGNMVKDDGLIIIIATEDRKVDIEVGYGLEGDINDAKAGEILDRCMVPHLKNSEWYEAIVAGLDCIDSEINK